MNGELGLGPEKAGEFIDAAKRSLHLEGIEFIECGIDFSLCIDGNGQAFMFGYNGTGECGAGPGFDSVDIPFCIQCCNEIDLKDVVFVLGSCGHDHTVLLTEQQDLYGFGGNASHQTGNYKHTNAQWIPCLVRKDDIGIDLDCEIVDVICDNANTIVICQE